MKNRFVVIEEKAENKLVLLMAKVLLLFSLAGQADLLERQCAFLQYKNCTRPLEGMDNEMGFVCLKQNTTD